MNQSNYKSERVVIFTPTSSHKYDQVEAIRSDQFSDLRIDETFVIVPQIIERFLERMDESLSLIDDALTGMASKCPGGGAAARLPPSRTFAVLRLPRLRRGTAGRDVLGIFVFFAMSLLMVMQGKPPAEIPLPTKMMINWTIDKANRVHNSSPSLSVSLEREE